MFSGVAWTITKWTDEALEAIGLTLDGLLEPEEPNAHGTVFSDGLVCACAQDGSGRGRMAARRCGVCGGVRAGCHPQALFDIVHHLDWTLLSVRLNPYCFKR